MVLSPQNSSFTSEGGSTFIDVYHDNGCNFTATSSDGWVADGASLRVYIGETSTAVPSVQYSPNGAFFAYGRDGSVVLAHNPFSSTIVPP